ncbi:hypothetical protein C8Q75DRAFT_794210 [Abortiporus biennis]|nr:hypothetical protein C8Q75DRAFT_794210 [Abortiporus biennis]
MPSPYLALLRIPILISTSIAVHIGQVPPNPPPAADERNRFDSHKGFDLMKLLKGGVLVAKTLNEFTRFARDHDAVSPALTSSALASLGFKNDAAPATTSYSSDPHAVSMDEALSYYAGLPSQPALIYRTGKWSSPKGPLAYRRLKELCEGFAHPIVEIWNNELGWKVVDIMDKHQIWFTTIDVVRFKKVIEGEDEGDEKESDAKDSIISPVTIWIAQDVLALLEGYKITDVDIDFRESNYVREVGPLLHTPVGDLDPLLDTRPGAQGTMAVYIAEGDNSDRLLGLTCRHVLISSKDTNIDYVYHQNAPARNVTLLGNVAFKQLVESIKLRIGRYGIAMDRWRSQIADFEYMEQGTDAADVANARRSRIKTQELVEQGLAALDALIELLHQVNQNWKEPHRRVLGHILRSPAITLGVGPHHFTEDYGIFQVNREKLGKGFQGNKIDLGAKLHADEFMVKCYPRGEANWRFKFPNDRLLPLKGIISDDLMHHPDMWDSDGGLCMLVKNGNATGTTIGRANGAFSIVRDYFYDPTIHQTSMEWTIINYDSKSEVFSKPGDSGSIIADIRGRIGGMLTGSSGKTGSSDMTYATPFWWLLERIQANGFPNVHLNVVA